MPFVPDNNLRGEVRNLASVQQALVRLTLQSSWDLEDAIARTERRFSAVWVGLSVGSNSLRRIVEKLASRFEVEGQIRCQGGEICVPRGLAIASAVVMQELITNAIEHGALRTEGGWVDITIGQSTLAGGARRFVEWKERGEALLLRRSTLGLGCGS